MNRMISQLDGGVTPMMADGEDKEPGKGGWVEHLKKSRTIELFGPVNSALAKRVISQLLFLEQDDATKPITIIQNSPGGSVTDGFAIYDTMRFVKPEIRILCVGLTASIATITLLGAKKENRLTLPHTEFPNQIIKTRERINQMLSAETGQPIEIVRRHTERDYWMTAEEAVEYGLIARIVDSRDALG